MGHLSNAIDQGIAELDILIARTKERLAAELAVFEKRRAALLATKRALTPEVESAVDALRGIGLLKDLD